jgi:hypothetical protein
MRISAAIMTHPSRIPYAEELRDHLPELNPTIVVDPAPEEGPSALRTARLAWQAIADDATHHLVLQDDAIPCHDFAWHLGRAVAANPDCPLSLFTEWGSETAYAVRLAALCGASLTDVVDCYIPTVGLVLPADLAREFSVYSDYDGPHDDIALRFLLRSFGVPALITVPNLVDHAGLPTILGGPIGRGTDHSACWLPDPGPIHWEINSPSAVPYLSWQTNQVKWWLPPTHPGDMWRETTSALVFRDRSLHESNIAQTGKTAVHSTQIPIPAEYLYTLWLTAYGLGTIAAEIDVCALESTLELPPTHQALSTMPTGALRFLVDRDRLRDHHEALSHLITQAIHQGHIARQNIRRPRHAL